MDLREFQLDSLRRLAVAFNRIFPEVVTVIDEASGRLTVTCAVPEALARRLGIPADGMEEFLSKYLSVDLNAQTQRLRKIQARLSGGFPRSFESDSLPRRQSPVTGAEAVRIAAIAVPNANALARPDNAVLINHSVLTHASDLGIRTFQFLLNRDSILQSDSELGKQLRRTVGGLFLKASNRLALTFPHGGTEIEMDNLRGLFRRVPGLNRAMAELSSLFTHFVVAHEISHVLLAHTVGVLDGQTFAQEFEADRLAAQVVVATCGGQEAIADAQVWRTLPAMVALLEMGNRIEVNSVETYGAMLRSRPNWDDRLMYLTALFPSDGSNEDTLAQANKTRLAISSVWADVEAYCER